MNNQLYKYQTVTEKIILSLENNKTYSVLLNRSEYLHNGEYLKSKHLFCMANNIEILLPFSIEEKKEVELSDFRLDFEYEEKQLDNARYFGKGLIWIKKTYGLNSPRLHKIQKLISEGKIRKIKPFQK